MKTQIVKTIKDGRATIEISKVGEHNDWFDYKLTVGKKSLVAQGYARVWTAERSAKNVLSKVRAGKLKLS